MKPEALGGEHLSDASPIQNDLKQVSTIALKLWFRIRQGFSNMSADVSPYVI
jgi:hypothetical protein